MRSDPKNNRQQRLSSSPEESPLHIRAVSEPIRVPVFNCVVYLRKTADGQVAGRVANLPEIAFTAANEPVVLRLVVTEFKQRLDGWTAAGQQIPWIEPPLEPTDDEQQRLVPVHL